MHFPLLQTDKTSPFCHLAIILLKSGEFSGIKGILEYRKTLLIDRSAFGEFTIYDLGCMISHSPIYLKSKILHRKFFLIWRHEKWYKMKPIEQDVIDFADDFFFHLSINQVKEKIEEFSKRQNFLNQYLLMTYNDLSGIIPREIMLRMVLVVDYCFSTYPVKINTISIQSMMDHMKWQNERLRIAEIETKHIPEISTVDYIKVIGDMGQDVLLTYFQNKIGICIAKNLFVGNDYLEFDMTLMTVGFLYQNQLRRQMDVVN